MRTKLTALAIACLVLGTGAVAAVAAGPPIPVATYTFQAQDDVNAFQKVLGTACKRKWVDNQAMAIGVGEHTNSCVFRSSVVGDSSATYSDLGVSASATVSGGSGKLQKKAYVSVGVRHSDTAGYELRILPSAHKWQYFRDPMGATEATLQGSGTFKNAKAPSAKPGAPATAAANTFSIQAFSAGGTATTLTAVVNGKSVVNTTDSGDDQPDGRQTVVGAGVKGTGEGTGVRGRFDDVSVLIPSPF
jgi:hypothetical protein